MDTIGKLLKNESFAKDWSKYRNGFVEYLENIPLICYPKKRRLVTIAYLNFDYSVKTLYNLIRKSVNQKSAILRIISDDELNITGCKHYTKLTIIIDLTRTLDRIFLNFNKATKQRIKNAKKNNLDIVVCNDTKEFDKWWDENYLTWAKKKKFAVENYNFIKSVFNHKSARLFLAYHNRKIIAGLLVMLSSNKVGFIWISSHDKKYLKLHPDHLLQWEVIKWLKINGYKFCDFGGVNHSKIFKQGFSKEISSWHVYDYEFNPIFAKFLKLYQKFRFYMLKSY